MKLFALFALFPHSSLLYFETYPYKTLYSYIILLVSLVTSPLVSSSSLGLCVESNTTGIIVAGWQTLTLSRDGFDFRAIENGIVPAALSNLVNPDCDSTAGHCVSEVELVALFFGTDGTLTVDGTVVLGFTNSTGAGSRRRRLAAKIHAEIKQSKNGATDSSRKLEDEDGEDEDTTTTAEGSFGISVMVHSGDASSSSAVAAALSLPSLIVSFGLSATMIYAMIGFMDY